MIWEQVQSLIRFHSQALNIPIELSNHDEESQSLTDPENAHVTFDENYNEPVRTDRNKLFLGLALTEEKLPVITQALEEELPPIAKLFHKRKRNQLKELVLSGLEERKRLLKESVLQAQYTLDNLNRQIFELTKTRRLDKQILEQLERPYLPIGKKIINEYHQLKKLVPGLFQSIQIIDGCIRAETHQVKIYWDDTEYEIGILLIELNLSTGQAKIHNLTNTANGYPHPHVNESGEICLGNIASGLHQMLGELELYGALELLHKFIHQYNEDDAYQKIQYWNDPDWCEEDDEYTRCRDGGSYGRTCLDCGDSYCPYYDNALNECVEDICFEKCVDCHDRCDPGIELLQDCHDEKPLNCVSACEFRTCMFFKDFEGCYEVNEELCPTCTVEACQYQGVPDEKVAI